MSIYFHILGKCYLLLTIFSKGEVYLFSILKRLGWIQHMKKKFFQYYTHPKCLINYNSTS